ncbi:hypothetical protein ABH944_001489 [Caballeronia udeis]|jgi:hypothetical protein|uniref:Ribosomal protein S14 n=1 Tax=Caballeronia udeis TaxID=1232866 RepID=A0ABW8MCK2_9BURK
MLEKHTSAWSRTVALLDNARARQVADEATRIAQRRPAKTSWTDHAALMVSVIELPTPRTATVSWCDPLSGYYGHQTWRVALAKQRGECVLSGKSIKPGDFIYRPATCQPPPGNAGAMIIASELVPHGKPGQS